MSFTYLFNSSDHYHQVEHGGSGPNHTVERIIKESPLVQTYRDVRATIDKNFALTQLTTAHSDPLMAKTFNELQKKLVETNPHEIIPGRKSAYIIEEFIDKGRTLLPTTNDNAIGGKLMKRTTKRE